MTKQQLNVLKALDAIPARLRVNGRARGWVSFELAESFDWRTVNSLIARGLIQSSEHGIRVRADSRS